MKDNKVQTDQKQEDKSMAQQDYDAGQKFLEDKEISQAANAFHNALIGFEQEGNENGIANASDKLGDICSEQGEIEKALEHFERAYTFCSKNFDRFSLFVLERKKAGLIYKSGDLAKALELHLDILDEYGALRNPEGSVETLGTLAEIYLKQGEKAKAADSYRMAASIHKDFKHDKHAEEFEAKAVDAEG
jgi:tetratricopeptide (TPR) repeat protein